MRRARELCHKGQNSFDPENTVKNVIQPLKEAQISTDDSYHLAKGYIITQTIKLEMLKKHSGDKVNKNGKLGSKGVDN